MHSKSSLSSGYECLQPFWHNLVVRRHVEYGNKWVWDKDVRHTRRRVSEKMGGRQSARAPLGIGKFGRGRSPGLLGLVVGESQSVCECFRPQGFKIHIVWGCIFI
jgi:hypothetical protein